MKRIIMNGCNGHMGRVITDIVAQDPDAEIVAGVDVVSSPFTPYPVYDDISKVVEEADVIIDFSTPKILTKLIDEAKRRGIALVLCTTGFTKEQVEEINLASKEVAIVRSANMSLGVNVLLRLVQEAAKKLYAEGFDIDIVEKHHHFKKDAPSGTALSIADAINEVLPEKLPYVFDRSDRSEPRPQGEIGISAVRGGTIVGDHEILFCGTDEVITIQHTAYSKAIFGKGAVVAAKYVSGREPGLYTMKDVIG